VGDCIRGRCDCVEAFCATDEEETAFNCVGVIKPDSRIEPGLSKRFCLNDGENLDLTLDMEDQELSMIAHVITGAQLNIIDQSVAAYR